MSCLTSLSNAAGLSSKSSHRNVGTVYLPEGSDHTTTSDARYAHLAPTHRARDLQRMGRGVRDVNDHCAVLLLGAGLGMAVHDRTWLDLFSPATRAQLKFSRDVAIQLSGQGIDDIRNA